jgi:hypothetical protein
MPRGLATKTLDLIAICREILEGEAPLTVRGVGYRLFNRKLIPDMGKNSTARVSSVLTTARERKMIPWSWIVDETREIDYTPSWDDAAAFVESVAVQYCKDRWASQPERVFVVSEKGTVGGILRSVIAGFGVPFAVYHGFGSASAVNLLARISVSDRRPLTLLYVGDHDPSGRFMSDEDLPGRLREYGGRATVERVALTGSDLPNLAASTFPASDKRSDSRYPWFVRHHGGTCCELDALDANVLRQRVERAIVDHLDAEAWNRAGATEEAEMESLTDFFASWKQDAA